MSSRILVTGAGGFLGRHVCSALAIRGNVVRGLVRSTGSLPHGVEAVAASGLHDREALRTGLRGVDAIVHLAARVHVLPERSPDPLAEFRRINVAGTRVLLEESGRAGVRQFVFMSSVAALGTDGRAELTDASPARPSTPYGISKLEAEELVEVFAEREGLVALSLRPPGVYGPEMKGRLDRLFRLLGRGLPIPVPGGDVRRSFVYVGTLVAAVLHALDWKTALGCSAPRYLIADPEAMPMASFLRRASRALGRKPRIVTLPIPLLRAAGRLGDLLSSVAPAPIDSTGVERLLTSMVLKPTRLERDLGFRPPFEVEEALERTGAWYRAQGLVT